MSDTDKSKDQLINELITLRERVDQLVKSEAECRNTEKILRKNESRYRTFIENSLEGVWHVDKDGYTIYLNRAMCSMLEIDRPEELKGITFHRFFSPEGLDALQRERTKRPKGISSVYEAKIIGKNGGLRDVIISGTPLLSQHGDLQELIGLFTDITERKKTEFALIENEQRYKKAQRLGHVGNWEFDLLTQKAWGSDETKRIYGFDPKGKDFSVDEIENCIIERERVRQAFTDLIRENKPYNLEFEIRPVAGPHRRIIKSVAELIKDDSGKPLKVVGVIQDITAQKEAEKEKSFLEKKLQQAQKMEAIGTLAGGIAHDFNNILSPLVGYAELLKLNLPADHPSQTYTDTMLKSALRARELVQQILSFSRKSELEIKPLRLQPIVNECLKLLRSSIPRAIDIEHHIDSDCSPVNADPTKFHQIVMNLATNAFHAMEKTGGKLTVTLKQIRIKQNYLEPADLLPGTYVQLTVADTGMGIKSDLFDKVFDPYFTTKETGKGTGLGLAVVHGIVKECGGDIRITSEPEKGTEIHVCFPAIKSMEIGRTEPAGALPGGTERILVVDDEVVVADMEQEMLEVMGYQVSVRTGSIDALEAFRANPDNFDLILTDMSMPNMSGIQLAQEIKKIKAGIPIIICTGFSDQLNDEKCEALGIQGFIMKPVVMRELAETIRIVLNTS